MRLLKRPAVEAKAARSKSEIYSGMARAVFPKPVPTGDKAVAWLDHELDRLIEIEIKARELGLRGTARDDFIRAELSKPVHPAAERDLEKPAARRRAAEVR